MRDGQVRETAKHRLITISTSEVTSTGAFWLVNTSYKVDIYILLFILCIAYTICAIYNCINIHESKFNSFDGMGLAKFMPEIKYVPEIYVRTYVVFLMHVSSKVSKA